jgi:high-affinity iron transporter
MAAGVLITIREGLEAFLVVGILLGYLRKVHQRGLGAYVWAGTGAGVLASVALAIALQALAVEFEESGAAPVFELAASLIAIPILSYMVLWMQRQARTIKSEIEARAEAAISTGQLFALAFIAFITVLREGLETAVFLSALASRASGPGLLAGAGAGLVLAAAIAYAYFGLTVRLNLRRFFTVTGVLLIFIAAGLASHVFMAAHELGLPVGIERVWSTKWPLDSESLAGRILHAFVGYHDEPNLLQILAYFGYLGAMGSAFLRAVRAAAPRAPAAHAGDRARSA